MLVRLHLMVLTFHTVPFSRVWSPTINIFISSPKGPNRHWGPPSLVVNRYRGSFPGIKRPLTSIKCRGQEWMELYLFSLYMPSWRGQGQIYFALFFFNNPPRWEKLGGGFQMSHPAACAHVTARIVGRPPWKRIKLEENMSYLNIWSDFRIILLLPWSRQGRTTDHSTAKLVCPSRSRRDLPVYGYLIFNIALEKCFLPHANFSLLLDYWADNKGHSTHIGLLSGQQRTQYTYWTTERTTKDIVHILDYWADNKGHSTHIGLLSGQQRTEYTYWTTERTTKDTVHILDYWADNKEHSTHMKG
jgi:hypothetical protein